MIIDNEAKKSSFKFLAQITKSSLLIHRFCVGFRFHTSTNSKFSPSILTSFEIDTA